MCQPRWSYGFLPSTSAQNSLAGLPLIVPSVLMERRIAVSRSALKSRLETIQGHPFQKKGRSPSQGKRIKTPVHYWVYS